MRFARMHEDHAHSSSVPPLSAERFVELRAILAQLVLKLTGVVVERRDAALAHLLEEPGHGEPGQLGGLSVTEPSLSHLLDEPQEPQLFGELLGIPPAAREALVRKLDGDGPGRVMKKA